MAKLKDTMIMAMDYPKMIKFYNEFLGLEIIEKTEQWTTLKDTETSQTLCITNGSSVRATAPGIEVPNLDKALKDLETLGGSVHKYWEFDTLKGANCYDPENNEMMIWEERR